MLSYSFVSYCQYVVSNLLLLESGRPVHTSELSYTSGLNTDNTVDMILNTKANTQSAATNTLADAVPNLLVLYMYLIPMNLSTLSNVTKNTDASLDNIDKIPATRQVILDRHASDGK